MNYTCTIFKREARLPRANNFLIAVPALVLKISEFNLSLKPRLAHTPFQAPALGVMHSLHSTFLVSSITNYISRFYSIFIILPV